MSDTYLDLPSRLEADFPDIESDIIEDLQENNEEYAALKAKIAELKHDHPVIDAVIEKSGEISLTAEEHHALTEYLHLLFRLADMERLQIYFRGHTDAVAYLKKIKAL